MSYSTDYYIFCAVVSWTWAFEQEKEQGGRRGGRLKKMEARQMRNTKKVHQQNFPGQIVKSLSHVSFTQHNARLGIKCLFCITQSSNSQIRTPRDLDFVEMSAK